MKNKTLKKDLITFILIAILVFTAFHFYNNSRVYEPNVVITEEGDEWDIDIPNLNF